MAGSIPQTHRLEALLLTKESDRTIAQVLHLNPRLVRAYRKMFFDVGVPPPVLLRVRPPRVQTPTRLAVAVSQVRFYRPKLKAVAWPPKGKSGRGFSMSRGWAAGYRSDRTPHIWYNPRGSGLRRG